MSESYGSLRINVRAADRAVSGDCSYCGIPIENARVIITDRDSLRTIEELRTDISGQTPPVVLPAPPPGYSQKANSGKPYSEYNVFIESDGFERAAYYGVQIFPDSASVSDAQLRYITGSGASPAGIVVPEPVLWGAYPAKIPENEVKELPPTDGYVVLPRAVIPEYIVVHLGTPSNASAQNVWVPFREYIKNVACSEIYCTWPKETIRANVTAIVSFTLNRVYTEWYRGKGYDFTITNTTAYDQAFSYGRTLFEEITVIVDEIFSTYLTRPGIRQPLLTQYCDGKKVDCEKGLKQWGSKELGDSGYTAFDILKYYYGYDCYYEQAEKVEGVPVSFGGRLLTYGSSGDDVRTVQEQLNRIGEVYAMINRLPVTGFYGEQTTAAVKTFQMIFGLPESGNVDFSTWYRISDIYTSIEKLAEL